MKSSFIKWGKTIEYSITPNAEGKPEIMWLVVKENPYTWIYITKRDFNDKVLNGIIRRAGVKPDYVKNKGMFRLFEHFGVDKDIKNNLKYEDKSSIKIDV
tara:strand:- start:3395 stop:3694 length:300 start_codon:yes stop_codon:yes gene_type:complete